MKTKALLSVATSFFVATSIFSAPAFASKICDLGKDRCSMEPLTLEQSDKSIFLGDEVSAYLASLPSNVKVVLIARRGQNTKSFKILKDNDGQETLLETIERLKVESKKAQSAAPKRDKHDNMPKPEIDYWVREKNIDKNDKLKYSHLGIAFRNLETRDTKDTSKIVTGPNSPDKEWAFLHLLYSCEEPWTRAEKELHAKLVKENDTQALEKFLAEKKESAKKYAKKSHVFREPIHKFFYEELHSYKAQIVIPTQKIQDSLEDILMKRREGYNFLQDQYNAAAKFDDLTQQNSNQFVLEALAAAMSPEGKVKSRQDAIEVLKNTTHEGKSSRYGSSKIVPKGWQSVLSFGVAQKALSSLMPTMCLKNQPELKKYSIAEIVTSNSVVNWMRRNKLIATMDDGREAIVEVGLSDDVLEDIEDWNSIQDRPVTYND